MSFRRIFVAAAAAAACAAAAAAPHNKTKPICHAKHLLESHAIKLLSLLLRRQRFCSFSSKGQEGCWRKLVISL
jgi:Spy/CpxP family protein refolding chaperone